MGFFQNFFGKLKVVQKYSKWRELGGYHAIFAPFGKQIYASDIVRDAVRPLAEYTSKANPKSTNRNIETLLTYRPNLYMNGKDFLSKSRNMLEIKNTLFIAIMRDERGHAIGFYPVPYSEYEAVEYANGLYIRFKFASDERSELVMAWDDLAVLRKDYFTSDIGGEDNHAIVSKLDLINTTNQGIANAVKSTANLRGILKNTKAMLDTEDVKKSKEKFVSDYMNLENSGGIASLDATQEFTPISMTPTVVSWEQAKEFREDVYRYFGVNDAIVMSTATDEQMDAFYDSRIQPFLIALSLELTSKVFTPRELGFGASIWFTDNRIKYMSAKHKLELVSMVDRGAMTPNEWRDVMGLEPIEGGDEPIRRLDTAEVNDKKEAEDAKEE